jgi:hypothetical protein
MGLQASLGQLAVDGGRGRQIQNSGRMGLQRSPGDGQVRGNCRGGNSRHPDAVGDLLRAGLGERLEPGGRGCPGCGASSSAGAPAKDGADRGHADRLVDDPWKAPGSVLVAREKPDGDRNEANRDERNNDVLGQHQTSRVGPGSGPDLRGDASTGSCPSKQNQTGPHCPHRTDPTAEGTPQSSASRPRSHRSGHRDRCERGRRGRHR